MQIATYTEVEAKAQASSGAASQDAPMSLTKPLQSAQQFTSAEQIEDIVRQLKDVISARAVLSPTGTLQELHVMTGAGRTPKLIVRDIESALTAQLGLTVDHKKISVAQTRFSHNLAASAPGGRLSIPGFADPAAGRLQLSNVTLSIQNQRAEASVSLKRLGDTQIGVAVGHASSQNQLRLVATATVRAVENGRSEDGTMLVEDVCTHTTIGGKVIVLVVISIMSERGEELLTGSALIRQDTWKAVAAASLNAVNRYHAAPPLYDEEFV